MKDKDQKLIWESYKQVDETVATQQTIDRARRLLDDPDVDQSDRQEILDTLKQLEQMVKTTDDIKSVKDQVMNVLSKISGGKFGRINENEYGPSGAPSIDVSDWKLESWYKEDEWESGEKNPWDKYVHKVLEDLDELKRDYDAEHARTYVAFFGPPQGSKDYEEWTDPGIVVAFGNNTEQYGGGTFNTFGIFVDNDGEGESFVLPEQQLEELLKVNDGSIESHVQDDEEYQIWDPYGPEGVVSRSDFY